MRFGHRALVLLGLLIVAGLFAGGTVASAPSFVAIDLGTLGGTGSQPAAIGPSGQIVGYSSTARDAAGHAFSWTENDGMVDLGTLGGVYSYARAVTPSGQVVGDSTLAGDLETHMFSWTQSGAMVDLGTLGGPNTVAPSTGQIVSPSGQIVGASQTAAGAWHAFSWTQAGRMRDLGTLGGPCSWAQAVSPSGQVVGYSDVGGEFGMCAWTQLNPTHAFSWTSGGGLVDLGTLGGTMSQAIAVTPSGQVIGNSTVTGDRSWHAFSWTEDGGMVDLGTLGGSAGYSIARAVSPEGQVVGWTDVGAAYGHAFSWTQAEGMVDLGVAGPSSNESWAEAVSPLGQVVGISAGYSGFRAFSWTRAGGMVDLGTLGGSWGAAYAVNGRGEIAGTGSIAGDGEEHAVLWRLRPGQYLSHVALTFRSDTGGRGVTWEADVPLFDISLERRDDGVLTGINGSAQLGDARASTLDLQLSTRGIGRLIGGSMTATRDGQRISAQKVVGLAYADRVEFSNRATYYDGRNTVFGDLTVRVTENR